MNRRGASAALLFSKRFKYCISYEINIFSDVTLSARCHNLISFIYLITSVVIIVLVGGGCTAMTIEAAAQGILR